jgi:hypothetical protein
VNLGLLKYGFIDKTIFDLGKEEGCDRPPLRYEIILAKRGRVTFGGA